jgi:cyclohexadienyl dehydratase
MRLLRRLGLAGMLAAAAALPSAAQSVLNEVLTGGVLKVGTTGDWNPMTVRDPATNAYKGYDIDVMTELAKDLEVKLEFVPTDWKTLVNGLVAGHYHMTGSASISPTRLKVAGFSTPYVFVEIYPFTTKDKVANFDGWDSINKAGIKVSTELGTTFEKWSKAWFPEAAITVVEAPARGYQEVLSGRADVFITSNIEGATLMAKFPQVVQVPVAAPRAPSPIAMLLPQGDQVWINYVNNWIEVKRAGGFFDELAKKWGLAGQS